MSDADLGDSLWATYNGYTIRLVPEDAVTFSNQVYLTKDQLLALIAFATNVGVLP